MHDIEIAPCWWASCSAVGKVRQCSLTGMNMHRQLSGVARCIRISRIEIPNFAVLIRPLTCAVLVEAACTVFVIPCEG